MESDMGATDQFDIILPAGGRIDGEFAAEAGASIKALIQVNGASVLEHTLRAARECPRVARIVVIGPAELKPAISAQYAAGYIEEGETGPENVFRGLEWLREANGGGHAARAVIMTTDLPFITGEHIGAFVAACPAEADVCVPVYERAEIEARFPDWGAEFVPMADGHWATGCGFLVNPATVLANRPRIEAIFSARKSQIGMGRLLGLGFVVKFLMHRLTIGSIVKRCEELLNCRAAAVHGAAPELCFDLDELKDLRYVRGREQS
jgi:GTP:adenosylcobinamide-phosphate guanylyltransferase